MSDWGGNKGVNIRTTSRRGMAKRYTPNQNQTQPEQKTGKSQGNQIIEGEIFQQDELLYDPLGVSDSWHQEATEPDMKERRKAITAQWKAKSDRTVSQQASKIERDPVKTIVHQHIQDEQVSEKAKQQIPSISRNLGAVSTKEKGMLTTAGMDRDAEVTVSLPRSNTIIVRRLKFDNPSEGLTTVLRTLSINLTNNHILSRAFYGLCAQLRMNQYGHKGMTSLQMSSP